MNKNLAFLSFVAIACGLGSLTSRVSAHDAALIPALQNATEVEGAFDAEINSADQLEWLKELSSAPNHVGSPHNRKNAERLLAFFKRWGWDARIERFDVLFPTPISTRVELIAPESITLGGQEPGVAADAATADPSQALPPYFAYQADGDVTADVVYVNYGMPEDYAALARRGISVRGRIVLVRFGHGWRGLKPKFAAEHGAVGCLIYSDPADDGYARYAPYPNGGGRPPDGIQRGSVMDWALQPGDPSTPGVAALPGVARISRKEAPTIAKVPALPISYADASRILSHLRGPVVPDTHRGALGQVYRWGGTDATRVRLSVKSDWSLKPVYNVIATVKGRLLPNEWVIRGNHHDGWVFGASDPLSGQVAMLSEAKAIGSLLKTGWRPDRTIVYASWDGEEAGLLGSTEWTEAHAKELSAKAVVYINTDDNSRGFLGAEGSHDLMHLLNAAAKDVIDPQTGVSVLDRLRARIMTSAADGGDDYPQGLAEIAKSGADIPIRAIGAGSDYLPFLSHLGIPTLSFHFEGEGAADGSYHSAYDTFAHVTEFDDPGLHYGVALAKLAGRVVLRAADSRDSPIRHGDLALMIASFVDDLRRATQKQRVADLERIRLVGANAYSLASKVNDPTLGPADQELTPEIDFSRLQKSAEGLVRAAKEADALLADQTISRAARARLHEALRGVSRTLLDPAGLPGRPWFRHLIYAPGSLTGYESKTLPGVREAVEQRHFAEAWGYIVKTADALDAYTARLRAAIVRASLPSTK